MNRSPGFHLFEQNAASLSASVDLLFFSLLALSTLVSLAVFVAVVGFSIRYRKGSRVDRSEPPEQNITLEVAWTLVPLTLFIGLFVWSAALYHKLYTPPADALEIFVVAKQWMWKLQHPEGRREINELHVPLGRPVKLLMTSEDVIHSFFVPAFRTKQDVLPGRYVSLWFQAEKPGSYPLFCAEYCGTDHSRMGGRVVVMEAPEYARWLTSGNDEPGMAAQGAILFSQFGCSGCHGENASVHAPNLQGVFGSIVPLEGGKTVAADERYVRDSILLPRKEVVVGYKPIMPSFQGQISEEQLLELVVYIKSLAKTRQANP